MQGQPHPILPDVMMNVPQPEALLHLVMTLMRQQTELLRGISDKQGATDNVLVDIRERIIRLELAEYAVKIKDQDERTTKLELRIKELEDEKLERGGVKKFLEWMTSHGWLLILAVAAWFYAMGEKVK